MHSFARRHNAGLRKQAYGAQRKWARRKSDCVKRYNSLIKIVTSVAVTMSFTPWWSNWGSKRKSRRRKHVTSRLKKYPATGMRLNYASANRWLQINKWMIDSWLSRKSTFRVRHFATGLACRTAYCDGLILYSLIYL